MALRGKDEIAAVDSTFAEASADQPGLKFY